MFSKKMKSLMFAAAIACAFSACGDSSSTEASKKQSADNVLLPSVPSVETVDDLPNCMVKREGDSSYVSAEESVYLCIDKAWRKLGGVVESADDLPNCTAKRDGERSIVQEENVTLICSDGRWLRYDIYKVVELENAGQEGANQEKTPESSSSSKAVNKWDDYVPVMSSSSVPASAEQGRSKPAEGTSSSKPSSSSNKAAEVSSSSKKQESSSSNVQVKSSSSLQIKSSSSSGKVPKPVEGSSTSKSSSSVVIIPDEPNTMIDPRDGQRYKTTLIYTRTWMAQNLNYESENSTCYNDSDRNCSLYGRVYKWDGAKSACPAGWHLPDTTEWQGLVAMVGGKMGQTTVATTLMSKEGWTKGKGTDDYGFNAVPGFATIKYNSGISYKNTQSSEAYFWTTDQTYSVYMNSSEVRTMGVGKDSELSVRCIKDVSFNKGSFKDPRDGQTYKTTTVGKVTWMAENLNYATKDSYCFNDSSSYCDKYGRLYTWDDAVNVCPSGWHLPDSTEWKLLILTVGGIGKAVYALKAQEGWLEDYKGSDIIGFSALPSGLKYDGSYYGAGISNGVAFWSATPSSEDVDLAYLASLFYYHDYGYEYVAAVLDAEKTLAYAVRCIKD